MRHIYNVFHPNDGLRPQRNFPVLLLQSRKMKVYTLQQNRCTSSSRSHSLSSSTIQYHIQLIYNALFYRGNTMGKILGLTQYHGSTILLANTHPPQKKFGGSAPKPPFYRGNCPRTPRQGERVYSTPGLQSQLNNIYGSRRLGSTTNRYLAFVVDACVLISW